MSGSEILGNQLKQIQRLRDIHLEAYLAYKNFEKFAEFRAPNVLGKEAKINAEALGNFKGFFNSAIRSLNYAFLMHTARMYIGAGSLTLRKIINTVEQNPTSLSDFTELHANESERLTSLDEYVGMRKVDIKQARALLDSVEEYVSKLQHNRNVYLVHLDIDNAQQVDTTYQEVFYMLEVADKILKLLTLRLDMRSESYQLIDQQIESSADGLMSLVRSYK